MVACGRYASGVSGRVTVVVPTETVAPAMPVDRLDLFGNEVEGAVTDYRLDPRGEMYERHSPETEIPRLGAPGV
jgi:hypothetical protein